MPLLIYANDPHWIRPLDKDVEQVFDPEKNKFFKQGSCSRWLLSDGAGKVVGRVAVFVNPRYKQEQPTGGIGFFECIDDQEAADLLFDHSKAWLAERGMEAMDGPINFGERDRWWGLVVEGFKEPLYCMNYNPPYYQRLFENYGFQCYFNQECFGIQLDYLFSEKFHQRHEELGQDPSLRATPIHKKDLERSARDFAKVYNKAWASHGGGKTLDERQAIKMFQSMKPVMDERLSWLVYHNEEPVACWINLPDLNEYFKHFNGRLGLWQKLRFLWMKKFYVCHRYVGLVFGIVPEWQRRGMDAYMILEGSKVLKNTAFKEYEMQWVGDFNPKMVNIAHSLGATLTRRLRTYRYLFDREKPFRRHPII